MIDGDEAYGRILCKNLQAALKVWCIPIIILKQELHVWCTSIGKTGIPITPDSEALCRACECESSICKIRFYPFFYIALRTIIVDEDRETPLCLMLDRIECMCEEVGIRLVRRHEDINQWLLYAHIRV